MITKRKQKSKKILLKRLRITKNGKVLRMQGFKRHLNAKKSSKRKRALGKAIEVNKIYSKKIRKIMGIKKGKENLNSIKT